MRLAILLLSFAALGFAEEGRLIPGMAEAIKEKNDKIDKITADFAKKEQEYFKKYITPKIQIVVIPPLSEDPRASEQSFRSSLHDYNNQVALTIRGDAIFTFIERPLPPIFFQQVGTLPDFRGSIADNAAPSIAEKKKPKITATLANGTRVE